MVWWYGIGIWTVPVVWYGIGKLWNGTRWSFHNTMKWYTSQNGYHWGTPKSKYATEVQNAIQSNLVWSDSILHCESICVCSVIFSVCQHWPPALQITWNITHWCSQQAMQMDHSHCDSASLELILNWFQVWFTIGITHSNCEGWPSTSFKVL